MLIGLEPLTARFEAQVLGEELLTQKLLLAHVAKGNFVLQSEPQPLV